MRVWGEGRCGVVEVVRVVGSWALSFTATALRVGRPCLVLHVHTIYNVHTHTHTHTHTCSTYMYMYTVHVHACVQCRVADCRKNDDVYYPENKLVGALFNGRRCGSWTTSSCSQLYKSIWHMYCSIQAKVATCTCRLVCTCSACSNTHMYTCTCSRLQAG